MTSQTKPKKATKTRRKKGQILDGIDQEALLWEQKKNAVNLLQSILEQGSKAIQAKAALQTNISPEEVASSTGLSLDEVKELSEELKQCH